MCVPSLSCYLISGLIPAYQQVGFDQSESGRWVINTCQSRSCSGQRSGSGPHREGVRHDVASSAAPPGVRRSGQSGIGARADRTRRCLAGWVPRPRATRPKLEIEPYHPRALLQYWPFAKKKKRKNVFLFQVTQGHSVSVALQSHALTHFTCSKHFHSHKLLPLLDLNRRTVSLVLYGNRSTTLQGLSLNFCV